MLRKNIQDPRKTPIQWPKQDKPPSFSQLEEMKGQANQNLGRSIELPFGIHVLFAQKSKGAAEVQWMLYKNEGERSDLEWEYSQQDLHILHTTIVAQFPDADWSAGGDRLSASGKKPGASTEAAPAAPVPPQRPAGGAPITPAGPPGGAPMPLLPPMLNQGGGMMPMMPGAMPGMPGAMPGMPGAMPGMPGAMPGMPGAMPGMPGAMPGMPGAMPGMQQPGMPGAMPQAQAPALPPEQAAFQNILQGQPGMPGSASAAPNPPSMPQAMPGQMPAVDPMQSQQAGQWSQPSAPPAPTPPAGQWVMPTDQPPQPSSQWTTPSPAPVAAPALQGLTPVSPEQASQWGPAPTESAPAPDPGFPQWSQAETATASPPDPGFNQWSQPAPTPLPTQATQWTDQPAPPEPAAQAASSSQSGSWSQPMPADQASQWIQPAAESSPQVQSGQWSQQPVADSSPQLQSGQWPQPGADSSQSSGQWPQPAVADPQSQWTQPQPQAAPEPEPIPTNDGAAKRPTMEGTLNKMQVPTLIEVVAVGKGTGRLEIIGASDVGQMYFKDGELLHALTRSMEGDMAVLDLIAWEGSYKFVPDEESDQRTVSKQIDALMVEATTLFDQLTSMEVEGLTMQSLIQRTAHGITESEFEQAVGKGVQANMQYQKMFYQAVDNQSSLEEVLRRSPLAKRDWVPVLFNLSKCGLVSFDHGDGVGAAPQATPAETEKKAPVAASTPSEPMPIDWNKVRELEQTMKRADTGLYSFYAFLLTLEKEFDRFDRFNRPLSIVIIEVDMIASGEPQPVDVEGLKRIASRIEKLKRKTDLLAHFEEHGLALLLPETPAASTRNVVTILIEALYATNMVEGVSNDALKLHIGSAGVPEDCKDIDELIKLARPDKASNKLAAS